MCTFILSLCVRMYVAGFLQCTGRVDYYGLSPSLTCYQDTERTFWQPDKGEGRKTV